MRCRGLILATSAIGRTITGLAVAVSLSRLFLGVELGADISPVGWCVDSIGSALALVEHAGLGSIGLGEEEVTEPHGLICFLNFHHT
jgi:hypothetical protein